MYAFVSFTISAVTSSISCLGQNQPGSFVNIPTLVVGNMTDLILSGVLAGDSPKSMNFGIYETTELLPKSITQKELTLALTLATVLHLIALLKMGVECPCSGENKFMEVLNV